MLKQSEDPPFFLTGATGSIVSWFGASRIELLMLGMTQTVLGLFAILGLVVVNASQLRINLAIPGTWLWISIFSLRFIIGAGLIWLPFSQQPAKQT